MKSRDFCYWLQGFFEIADDDNLELNSSKVQMIKKHLSMVFLHEIDPSFTDSEELNKIHNDIDINLNETGKIDVSKAIKELNKQGKNPVYRC